METKALPTLLTDIETGALNGAERPIVQSQLRDYGE